MSIPPEVISAYQKALYWVRTSPNILLRLSSVSEEARQLLDKHEAESAAIITSDNPQSELRSEEENSFYRDQLQQEVIQSQCPFFVIDLPLSATYRLLQKFDQCAAVWVEKDGRVSLLPRPVETDPESD